MMVDMGMKCNLKNQGSKFQMNTQIKNRAKFFLHLFRVIKNDSSPKCGKQPIPSPVRDDILVEKGVKKEAKPREGGVLVVEG